jgi:hypothetical protein
MDVSVCAAYTCADNMSVRSRCRGVPATDRNMILGFWRSEVNITRGVKGTFQENVVVADFGYWDLFYLEVLWLSLG